MSHAEGVNVSRRRMLIGTTAAMGAVGAVAALTPFVKSWNPSAKAKAAGAAPLYRGQPGYRSALDGDDDGVACES